MNIPPQLLAKVLQMFGGQQPVGGIPGINGMIPQKPQEQQVPQVPPHTIGVRG